MKRETLSRAMHLAEMECFALTVALETTYHALIELSLWKSNWRCQSSYQLIAVQLRRRNRLLEELDWALMDDAYKKPPVTDTPGEDEDDDYVYGSDRLGVVWRGIT